LQAAVVQPLWTEMEALCRDHLARLTIADLIKRAAAAGVKRPTVEPLNFVI
jgi:molybdenum cofactor biosynthesis enzyme